MPENLFNRDFSAGWCPSDDAVDGRPNALLQMDNLELDLNGALQLIHGTVPVWTGFAGGEAHTMFSRFINTLRCDYSALNNGAVYRNNVQIVSGGDMTNAAFGTAFNYTLICSGSKRVKDSGSGGPVNLGVLPPTLAPTVTQNATLAPWALIGNMQTNVALITGAYAVIGGSNYIQCTMDPTTNTFAIQTNDPGHPAQNCMILNPPGGTGYGTDEDFVIISGYTPYPYGVKLQFDVMLKLGDFAGDPVTDTYSFSVTDLSQTANFDSVSGVFTLRIPRNSFTRIGSDGLDWSKVYGFRLTIVAPRDPANPSVPAVVNIWSNYWGLAYFVIRGGTSAQFGTYQYAQVNVNNTGSYIAKSILGPQSVPIVLDGVNAHVSVQDPTAIDPQCNEAWIFRTGGNLGGTWYRVGVVKSPWINPFVDITGDQAALELDITIDPRLISIAQITDKVYDIIGPVQGRWFYFTTNFMYPSEINDPDLVNPGIAVRTCGSTSELYMWARAVSASVVLVGTSIDCYLLTGTFATFPDGTIDVYYQNLGVKFPPLTYDAVAYGGAVYYLASDGWRMVTPTTFGSTYSSQNNQLIVAPNLDRLYRGERCYGYTPPAMPTSPGSKRFPVTIAKNKLWCFITGTAGRGEVYDFLRQYWRPFNYGLGDVTACTSTQDNKVLVYNIDRKVREYDNSGTKVIDGANQQTITALFTYKDNGTPRQRKDTYTFKSRCLTAGGPISTSIYDEKGFVYKTVNIDSPTVTTEVFADLSSGIGLPKSYQVLMSGQVGDFILEDFSIDYDLRPAPLTYLKVLQQNYGTTARKRIYTVPFQIDTLGNTILIQPQCDGVNYPVLPISTNRKQSVDYFFNLSGSELVPIARDYDWIINGQGKEFEWFGFQDIRNIEIHPDPQHCLRMQAENYGTTSRKRIYTIPFQINTLGNNVSVYPIVDNIPQPVLVVNCSEKQSFDYQFKLIGVDITTGIDYEWIVDGGVNSFEWYGFQQIKNIEVFPDAQYAFVIPKTNFGAPVQKRYRTWPFMINTRGQIATFTPIVDNILQPPMSFTTGAERQTVFYYFTSDVFGIDYSGTFSAPGPIEIWDASGHNNIEGMNPDSVQNLPISKEFDQVGPLEIFRWGKILRMALRTVSNGTVIPFKIYINDVLLYEGVFNTVVGVEDTYIVDLPKGVSGRIMRIELGPCAFTFNRYYMKFQVAQSGGQENTELQWLTVPGMQQGA